MAPNRRRRPGAAAGLIEEPTEAELDECPFCAGREDRTPPESFRVGAAGAWTVRVVPNLYPAFERQEVVVHSPRHVRSFADLADAELAAIAAAWHERGSAAYGAGYRYVHVLINEGAAAGASRAHSHSQLVWLKEPPPEIVAEQPRLREDDCALCKLLASHRLKELVVARREGVVALAHPAGRLPYELLIAGDHWGGQPGYDGGVFLVRALELLRQCVGSLQTIEGAVPWNAWLHSSGHWHFEVLPRLSVLAGVELGAGIYVNNVPPEDAVGALRGVLGGAGGL